MSCLDVVSGPSGEAVGFEMEKPAVAGSSPGSGLSSPAFIYLTN